MSQLKVNSIVPSGGLPSGANGGIIQVVSTVLTSAASFNVGNGATDNLTGLSASITPSSSSNKILIIYHIQYDTSASNGKGGFRIKRGSTFIGDADSDGANRYECNAGFSANADQDQSMMCSSNSFLDSPSTTSATTYQMCMLGGGTTLDVFINRSRFDGNDIDDPRVTSSLILMEVSV